MEGRIYFLGVTILTFRFSLWLLLWVSPLKCDKMSISQDFFSTFRFLKESWLTCIDTIYCCHVGLESLWSKGNLCALIKNISSSTSYKKKSLFTSLLLRIYENNRGHIIQHSAVVQPAMQLWDTLRWVI